MKKLLLIGAGGHTRVVIETARLNGYDIIGIIDTKFAGQDEAIMNIPVLGGMDSLSSHSPEVEVFVSIGDNNERQSLSEDVLSMSYTIPILVHPTAIVSGSANIGRGVIINSGAILNSLVAIGDGVIINTGAIVDHECEIGPFSHVCPGTSIAGRVSIGHRTTIGIGSSVIDKTSIGNDVMIGAGSVIIRDITDGEKIGGVSKPLT